MNMVFKIVMFTFFLNIGTGIMAHLIPDYTFACGVFNADSMSKFNSTEGYVNPNNNLQDQTSAFIRLIDSLNIGIIGKFLSSLNYYLYGSIDFMKCFMGFGYSSDYDWFFYLLKGVLTASYILGAIYLWTGRAFNR